MPLRAASAFPAESPACAISPESAPNANRRKRTLLAYLHKQDYHSPYMESATPQESLAGFSTDTAADLSRRDVQERLSPAAIRAFFQIAQCWRLRDEDARHLLGGISNGAFYQLKRGHRKTLDQDKLTRISLLIGIFRALNILYSRKLADSWVGLPNTNPMFEGETPLDYMIRRGQPALLRVRQLLDARRGGR